MCCSLIHTICNCYGVSGIKHFKTCYRKIINVRLHPITQSMMSFPRTNSTRPVKFYSSLISLTFLAIHVGVDFTSQKACFVNSSVGVMGDIQERVAAAADPADALRVGIVVLGVCKLRQRFLQLVPVTEGNTRNTTFTFLMFNLHQIYFILLC